VQAVNAKTKISVSVLFRQAGALPRGKPAGRRVSSARASRCFTVDPQRVNLTAVKMCSLNFALKPGTVRWERPESVSRQEAHAGRKKEKNPLHQLFYLSRISNPHGLPCAAMRTAGVIV